MTFSPITLVTLASIEKIINKALALDVASQQKISVIAGKSIAIHITDVNSGFYIVGGENELRLQSSFEGEPDVTLKGSTRSLAKLMVAKDKTIAMLASDIEIIGDIAVAQTLQSVFSELNIDWEAQLSHLTSGVVAHEFSNIAKSLNGWVRNTFSHFADDVKEYLGEEAPFTTPKGKVDAYFNELDEIKMRMDRIDAHITRLNEALKKQTGNQHS